MVPVEEKGGMRRAVREDRDQQNDMLAKSNVYFNAKKSILAETSGGISYNGCTPGGRGEERCGGEK